MTHLGFGNFGILVGLFGNSLRILLGLYIPPVLFSRQGASYRLLQARLVGEGPFFHNIRAYFHQFLLEALRFRFLFFLTFRFQFEYSSNQAQLEALAPMIV